jgi:hypothetical protein
MPTDDRPPRPDGASTAHAAHHWILGVLGELGLAEHPDWIHVALALDEPIRGQITVPKTGRGVAFEREGFECEDDARVPGIESGRVELFGLEVDLSSGPPRRPLWTLTMPDHTALVVEPWRRYAFPNDIRLYAQVDWRPTSRESASIHGGEFDEGPASNAAFARARAAQHALLTLKQVTLQRGGGRKELASRDARKRLLRLADLVDAAGDQIEIYTLSAHTTRSPRTISYWLQRAEWGIEDLRIQLHRSRKRQSTRKLS